MNYVPFISEVETFNIAAGKTESNTYIPNIPDKDKWMFIYNFVREELEELRDACESNDIVGVLDALCDIQYVAGGNGVMVFGMKNVFVDAYAEVHRSNMSKFCTTEEEAKETAKVRAEEMGIETHYEKTDNTWTVFRSSDRKVLKSINYSKPNLRQFLN